MKREAPRLPVAVLGAGPVGLAAAAHLAGRGLPFVVFESGASVATHFESTRHVGLFSPWRYNIDSAARALLDRSGWDVPPLDRLPTCGELIDGYLRPLASLPEIAPFLRYRHRVLHVAKAGYDKLKSAGRDDAPFVVRLATPAGVEEVLASSVLDATGTWSSPNPLGANGLPASGEREFASRIAYGMPDVAGRDRGRYAGRHVLVAGAGHSAIGTLIALAQMAEGEPGTRISWAIRGHNFERILGGGANDGLPARGALGARLRTLREAGRLDVHPDFKISGVRSAGSSLEVFGVRGSREPHAVAGVDQVVVATGARPDFSLASELRVKLDPWIESTEALAPLIDPNVHSCGTVRPHGHRELAHPERGYYALGAKSYGRAPNFLMATGYEQARSVVAALAGDLAAADDVQLELPETGVCSTQFEDTGSGCCTIAEPEPLAAGAEGCSTSGCGAPKANVKSTPAQASTCCGGPPAKRADACCVKDEVAKDAGAAGCGCPGSPEAESAAKAGARVA